jgi:hypothetical protein
MQFDNFRSATPAAAARPHLAVTPPEAPVLAPEVTRPARDLVCALLRAAADALYFHAPGPKLRF